MRLQIDFDNKKIKLETDTNLGEFFDKITQLPIEIRDYTLETNVTINWNRYPTWYYNPYNPVVWCSTTGSSGTVSISNNTLTSSNTTTIPNGNTIYTTQSGSLNLNL